MFNASTVVTQKSPLEKLLIVIRNPKKLSKEQIINTNIKVIYTENDMRTFERRMSINNFNDTIDTSNSVDMLVRAPDDGDMTVSADFNLSKFDDVANNQNWLDMTASEGSSVSRFITSPSDRFKTPETNRRSSGFSSLETQRTYQSIGENINEQEGGRGGEGEGNEMEFDYTEPMMDQDDIFQQQQDFLEERLEGRESNNNRRSNYYDTVEKLRHSLDNNNPLELDDNDNISTPLNDDEDYDGLTESAKHRRAQSLLNKSKRRKTLFDKDTELPDEIVRKMRNVEDVYSDDDEDDDNDSGSSSSDDDEEEEDGNRSRRKKRKNNGNKDNNNNIDNIIKKRKYKKPEYSKFINPITAFIKGLPAMKKLPRDEDNDDVEEIDLTKLGLDGEENVEEEGDDNQQQQQLQSYPSANDTMQQTPIAKDNNNTISYLDGPTFNDTMDDVFEMNNYEYNDNSMIINEDGDNTMIINQISKSMEIVEDLKRGFEENDVVEFQQIVSDKTKRNVASDFLSLLTLAANNYVIANQNKSYDAIEIQKGEKWSEFEKESE